VEKVKTKIKDESSPDVGKVVIKKQEPVVPAHLAAILAMRRQPTTASEPALVETVPQLLPRNKDHLEPDPSRSLVGVDWDKQSRLVLEFDTGEKLVSKPIPVNEVRSSIVVSSGNTAGAVTGVAESFETVSKNLPSSDAVYTYNGTGDLASITYSNGIIKTLNYSLGVLTSVVLSGATPSGIELTKSLTYTATDLTAVTYS
jgi:hypothetical protein